MPYLKENVEKMAPFCRRYYYRCYVWKKMLISLSLLCACQVLLCYSVLGWRVRWHFPWASARSKQHKWRHLKNIPRDKAKQLLLGVYFLNNLIRNSCYHSLILISLGNRNNEFSTNLPYLHYYGFAEKLSPIFSQYLLLHLFALENVPGSGCILYATRSIRDFSTMGSVWHVVRCLMFTFPRRITANSQWNSAGGRFLSPLSVHRL